MGQTKKALMESESNGHVHPVFKELIAGFIDHSLARETVRQLTAETTPRTTGTTPLTIYGMFIDGMLIATYSRRDTAEYECWLSRVGDECTYNETPRSYDVRELTLYRHSPQE